MKSCFLCGNTPLFDFFHGYCWYYAKYFQTKNPEWKTISLIRNTFWKTNIHTFCTKQEKNKTLFADARGITDDPTEFFQDYTFSKNIYIQEDNTKMDPGWYTKDYQIAYDLIHKQ